MAFENLGRSFEILTGPVFVAIPVIVRTKSSERSNLIVKQATELDPGICVLEKTDDEIGVAPVRLKDIRTL